MWQGHTQACTRTRTHACTHTRTFTAGAVRSERQGSCSRAASPGDLQMP